MSSPLWAVLPGGIDDPAAPSGGNRYDRVVLSLLARDVHEVAIPGSWPSPGPAAQSALARALTDIPDKSDVLIDGLVACGVPSVLEPHARRLRLLVLVHLPLSDETGLPRSERDRLRALERRTLHLADTVIATSSPAALRISEMHGLSGVEVAAPGVEMAAAATPGPGGRRLLCVASVTHRKGQDLLVSALEQHLADLDWRCTFVGALREPVRHADPRITFTGPLAGADLDAAYAGADLFVLPSRAETYGMVVTEALARALPVVAAEVGGVPEALGRASDGRRPGVLIPPDDPSALAAALREWLTDPDLRDRWRTAARDRRQTLPTWAETARSLSDIIEGVPR
ncbi:glycosyltransferase family 4 protein [Actinoplanes sp. NPDC051411]|uniref:glycosyltransferase family 4 protein n=1 Tax=Actinoplanes sp. NPDC051411 TaxID=3155522 RepID=UPI0034139A67